jgi:hypothetical protein
MDKAKKVAEKAGGSSKEGSSGKSSSGKKEGGGSGVDKAKKAAKDLTK